MDQRRESMVFEIRDVQGRDAGTEKLLAIPPPGGVRTVTGHRTELIFTEIDTGLQGLGVREFLPYLARGFASYPQLPIVTD